MTRKTMQRRVFTAPVAFILAAQFIVSISSFAQTDTTLRAVRLIEQRCTRCHGGEIVNAGVDFSDLRDSLNGGNAPDDPAEQKRLQKLLRRESRLIKRRLNSLMRRAARPQKKRPN